MLLESVHDLRSPIDRMPAYDPGLTPVTTAKDDQLCRAYNDFLFSQGTEGLF